MGFNSGFKGLMGNRRMDGDDLHIRLCVLLLTGHVKFHFIYNRYLEVNLFSVGLHGSNGILRQRELLFYSVSREGRQRNVRCYISLP